MLPIIHFFGRDIGMYSVMGILGLLVCGFVISFYAKRKQIRFENIILALVSAMAGLLVGGHLLYGIVNFRLILQAFQVSGLKNFIVTIGSAFGGSVFYGGFLGGILGVYVFLKIEKTIDPGDMFDLYAIAVPLFHTFGRIGCFLAGCCYGIESEIGCTAHGNLLSPGVNDVSRFPVQLVEAGLNLGLFFILLSIDKRRQHKGQMLFIYMLIYPVYRFILEFFRGDIHRGLWFGLSTSQWISIVLFLVGAIGLVGGMIRVKKVSANS